MFFKVIHDKEVHIYNFKGPVTLLGLKAYIKSAFKTLPQKYHLEYEDIELDLVTIANEDDFQMMFETTNKIVKIFIKEDDQEFYDETDLVALDEIYQLSKQASLIDEEDRGFFNMTEHSKPVENKSSSQEPKEETKILESIPSSLNESKISSISQVTDAQIEEKFNRMLPGLIGKVKEELVKESLIKSEIKQKSEIKPSKKQVNDGKVIHRNIICDECGVDGIEGIRYKCAICPDFDLCEKCEAKTTHDHPFLKIKHLRHAPLKIFAMMKGGHQNQFQVDGQRVPFRQFPFISDIYEAFLGPRQQGQCKQGFKFPQFFKGYCPFKKGGKKCEEKCQKPEKKVEEKLVEQMIVPKVEEKKEEKKVEEKKEEMKIEDPKDTQVRRMMLNASYLNQILEIDYSRCYKFAQKNPKSTQEELLELYFQNTNALI